MHFSSSSSALHHCRLALFYAETANASRKMARWHGCGLGQHSAETRCGGHVRRELYSSDAPPSSSYGFHGLLCNATRDVRRRRGPTAETGETNNNEKTTRRRKPNYVFVPETYLNGMTVHHTARCESLRRDSTWCAAVAAGEKERETELTWTTGAGREIPVVSSSLAPPPGRRTNSGHKFTTRQPLRGLGQQQAARQQRRRLQCTVPTRDTRNNRHGSLARPSAR